MKIKVFSLLVLSCLLLAACAPAASTEIPSPPGPTHTPVPTEAAPSPAPTHLPVDLTPAQRAAIQALADKYKMPADQIKLVNTEAMTWENGCLGVVIPGVMCTKGPVDGFRILLEANGKQYEFHTNQDGTNVVDAAQQLASIRLAVYTSQKTTQLVDPNIPLGLTYNPAFNGLPPYGGSVSGTAYVLDFTNQTNAVAVVANGTQELSFIQNPNYGLAVWPGGPGAQPRLAWGTQPSGSNQSSSLQISNVDGSQLETLMTQDASANPRMQLVAELWSADGQSLYFSKEPLGLGGYILFTGASNLYKIDIASKKVTELIPANLSSGVATCLDGISSDYQFVAEACAQNMITVRNLASGDTTTIQPPEGASGFRILGSCRFSPDGSRVAYALAKGDPSAEQGWVAVSDRTSGGSKLILTGQAGTYYTIPGWLDDQTLLVQSNSLNGSELWTVGIDGSNQQKVADGSFLTVVDNR